MLKKGTMAWTHSGKIYLQSFSFKQSPPSLPPLTQVTHHIVHNSHFLITIFLYCETEFTCPVLILFRPFHLSSSKQPPRTSSRSLVVVWMMWMLYFGFSLAVRGVGHVLVSLFFLPQCQISLCLLSWRSWFVSYFLPVLESWSQRSPLGLCSLLPLESRLPSLGTAWMLAFSSASGFYCYQCLMPCHVSGWSDCPVAEVYAACMPHDRCVWV